MKDVNMFAQTGEIIMEAIIRYFEGINAVVEYSGNKMGYISKALLPGAKIGDVINVEIDTEASKRRREEIAKCIGDLIED